MSENPTRVLFVCLGNICRSPLAEGVFRSLVHARGLDHHYRIGSAGTGGWHAGERPDARSIAVALRNGVRLTSRARQVRAADLDDFDYLIAMDRQNLSELTDLARAHEGSAAIHLLREFDSDPGDRQVPDPYYGGEDGFDRVYAMVLRACTGLLDTLEAARTRKGSGGKPKHR
jgi:protein-tyrosine phosphatase